MRGLSACCVVAEADALASVYDCDAELARILDRVARGIRFLPPVPQRVAAMLHTRLEPAEHAMFSMLLAGLSASDVARGLRMSRTEFESRRWALLGGSGERDRLLLPAGSTTDRVKSDPVTEDR